MDGKSVARLKREPLDLAERALDMDKVAKLYLQGERGAQSITKISKQLGLSRAYVETLLEEFKQVYTNDHAIRERAKEVVGEFDAIYDRLRAELYRAANDAEMEGDLKTRVTALKNIADIEAKRVDTLQKSGLLANMDLAEELAANEEKQAALIQIIKDVVAKYPELKVEIARRLSALNNQAEPVEVEVVE